MIDTAQTLVAGTSFATPIVSAAAALVWQANPALTPAEVTGLLCSTAKDMGATGNDEIYGGGLLDVGAAVNAALAAGGQERRYPRKNSASSFCSGPKYPEPHPCPVGNGEGFISNNSITSFFFDYAVLRAYSSFRPCVPNCPFAVNGTRYVTSGVREGSESISGSE